MLTRRDLLRLGILGGTAAVLPLDRVAALASGARTGHGQIAVRAVSPPVVPFEAALPVPSVLEPVESDATTDWYEIDMHPAEVEILPGLLTTIWGYNGQFPGPTIKARQGRRAVVRQVNHLDVETVVHLHGGRVAPEHDGHPLDVIPPGGAFDYFYPNEQPGATLWYHDHTLGVTGRNVYMGLAGLYLLEGADEPALNLPDGEFDVPLILQDRLFAEDGSLIYTGNTAGMVGDTLLVNGAPQPHFEVARRAYRLRLLNGSNYLEYDLSLDPLTFTQIASDGGLLPTAVRRKSLRLAPAERVEVVVDFSGVPLGSQVVLKNKLGSARTNQVMRFDVVEDAGGGGAIPPILRRLPNLGGPAALRKFELELEDGMWLINHKGFDPDRFDATPRLNTAEVWEFKNVTGDMHPMHLHLVQFRVLTRDLTPVPLYELGPKDTVAVRAGETVRLMARFDGFTGPYVFHCHRLEHEDRDMMGQFQVVR
ncbi:MAG TPA: multicopper oxidase domain-containing protein [Acidimicrobiales bacterium]|nr:multicopper oxidase domain-containing protein [Acidimicrobiales bacterium]